MTKLEKLILQEFLTKVGTLRKAAEDVCKTFDQHNLTIPQEELIVGFMDLREEDIQFVKGLVERSYD